MIIYSDGTRWLNKDNIDSLFSIFRYCNFKTTNNQRFTYLEVIQWNVNKCELLSLISWNESFVNIVKYEINHQHQKDMLLFQLHKEKINFFVLINKLDNLKTIFCFVCSMKWFKQLVIKIDVSYLSEGLTRYSLRQTLRVLFHVLIK